MSKQTGFAFYDLDNLIERDHNRKISDIFRVDGEAYFRKLERDSLLKLLSSQNSIIAVGGGCFVQPANFEDIKQSGISVFLNAPLHALKKRLRYCKTRPILKNTSVEEILRTRFPLYNKADVTVDLAMQSKTKSVDLIIAGILSYLDGNV